ncbi:MAG: hypothetical protein MK108_13125 [Mariniblastus sp.]|nr:hypothetical protein [Mariniblastus sp.]
MQYWPHPAALPNTVLLENCRFERTRRGGPGGQHRNKVESAIVAHHLPTGVTGQASERRSQHSNRQVALNRLRLNLAIQVRTEIPADRDPSPLWQQRLSGKKISVGVDHEDFPAVIAEVLDWLQMFEFRFAPAAKKLGCSTSQLIKLVQANDQVLTSVNRVRQQMGKCPLK